MAIRLQLAFILVFFAQRQHVPLIVEIFEQLFTPAQLLPDLFQAVRLAAGGLVFEALLDECLSFLQALLEVFLYLLELINHYK